MAGVEFTYRSFALTDVNRITHNLNTYWSSSLLSKSYKIFVVLYKEIINKSLLSAELNITSINTVEYERVYNIFQPYTAGACRKLMVFTQTKLL